MKKIFSLMFMLIAVGILAAGCMRTGMNMNVLGNGSYGILAFNSIEDKVYQKYMRDMEKEFGKIKDKCLEFANLKQIVLELENEKILYSIMPEDIAKYIARQNDDFAVQVSDNTSTFHMATRKEDSKLCNDLSKAINELKEEGTMADLIDEYIKNDNVDNTEKKPDKKQNNYVVGITGDYPPFDYVDEGGIPAGFNVALMNAIGEKMSCTFTFVQVTNEARLTALSSKKIDIVFLNNIIKVDDFKLESDDISITEPYYENKTGTIYLKKYEDEIKMK